MKLTKSDQITSMPESRVASNTYPLPFSFSSSTSRKRSLFGACIYSLMSAMITTNFGSRNDRSISSKAQRMLRAVPCCWADELRIRECVLTKVFQPKGGHWPRDRETRNKGPGVLSSSSL